MITGFTIENFKGIRDPVEIELRPLTLLFGANSAGKSSILQALQYAQDVFLRHNLDADRTIAGGRSVDLGGFRQLVHGHDLDRVVRLAFTIDLRKQRDDDIYWPLEAIHEFLQFDRWCSDPLVFDGFGVFSQAKIRVSVAWSSYLNRPIVARCEIHGDAEIFATISTPPDGRSVILEINDEHTRLSKLNRWGEQSADLEDIAEVYLDPERSCLSECLAVFRRLCQTTKEGMFFLAKREDALLGPESEVAIERRDVPDNEMKGLMPDLHGASMHMFFRDMLEGISRLIMKPLEILRHELSQHRYLGRSRSRLTTDRSARTGEMVRTDGAML